MAVEPVEAVRKRGGAAQLVVACVHGPQVLQAGENVRRKEGDTALSQVQNFQVRQRFEVRGPNGIHPTAAGVQSSQLDEDDDDVAEDVFQSQAGHVQGIHRQQPLRDVHRQQRVSRQHQGVEVGAASQLVVPQPPQPVVAEVQQTEIGQGQAVDVGQRAAGQIQMDQHAVVDQVTGGHAATASVQKSQPRVAGRVEEALAEEGQTVTAASCRTFEAAQQFVVTLRALGLAVTDVCHVQADA